MTFSITGRCEQTDMLGTAVSSSSICVAARCAFARAGVGAVSSQNVTNPALGLKVLEHLSAGESAEQALIAVLRAEDFPQWRQIAIVDARGRTAHHSGDRTLGRHAVATGANCVAAGNLLASNEVPRAMAAAFETGRDNHLAERLLRALEAGLHAGGEAGPVRSAGLRVAHEQSWPLVDLRVDWHDAPVAALRTLWELYAPQMNDYVTRALAPDSAPSFGVAGDP